MYIFQISKVYAKYFFRDISTFISRGRGGGRAGDNTVLSHWGRGGISLGQGLTLLKHLGGKISPKLV